MKRQLNSFMEEVEDLLFIDVLDCDGYRDKIYEYWYEIENMEDIKNSVELDDIFCDMLHAIDTTYEFEFGKITLDLDSLYDEYIDRFYRECALILEV